MTVATPPSTMPGAVHRAGVALAFAAPVALLLFGLWWVGLTPQRLWSGLGRLGTFVVLMVPPDFGTVAKLQLYAHALAQTVAIAFLGTGLAAVIALPLGFLAARNVVAQRLVHFLARRSLDTVRGVDTLIWALIWINVVGLGPFAGVLAIMSADIGAFGKMFSEAIEATDRRAGEGVVASGGGRLHRIRFGILPQVLPVMLSQVLYYIESNTRSATIIGIVGAGGIGLHLAEEIRTLEWQAVAFLILMILATVAAIDWLSSILRTRIVGTRLAPV
ncbi:phosphonate transport system permease protein [Stella humosa]|uniref:Phosphonate transport system permease protein n=1 Tax=Stella humosa TaxID=94 RepID=A0A3N1L018_9PROT|nr:phosphonate ABC transporter, permease protein PhnE [Stella humosa]ROP83806.1 phosphonate transport system permease protein [Stella humosa]BBK32933.1 phosphonate ABC transporter, permease protein PhnE [Stella humosa]